MLATPAGAARVILNSTGCPIEHPGKHVLLPGIAWQRSGPNLLLDELLSGSAGSSWRDLQGFSFIALRADPTFAAPLWAELTPEESAALRDELSAILAEREPDQGAKPGIDATLYTGLYESDLLGVLQLPDDVHLRILPEYRGFDVEGNAVYDSRITLVAHDYKGRAQPFVAHMHDDAARELLAALTPGLVGELPPTDNRMPRYRIEHPVLRGDEWRTNR